MKIKILFSVIAGVLLLNSTRLFCQSKLNTNVSMSRVIRIDSLYKCYGVIFDSSYNPPIEIHNIKERFTPSDTDVIIAEQIFVEQYNASNQASKSRNGTKVLNDAKTYFEEFNRQYIGYIDNEGAKNLIVHLFDYSKKREVKKYIGDSWKNSFVIVLADKPPFDILTYRADITHRKLYANF